MEMFLEEKNLTVRDIDLSCSLMQILLVNVNEAQSNAEICNIIADTFLNCGLKADQFTINVSNRKIVQGLVK